MEFITASRDEIRAASRDARSIPLSPLGSSSFRSVTNVVLGSLPGNSASAMTPGSAKMKTGVSFSRMAKLAPQRDWSRFLAPSSLCTFTWSMPQ